jgi:rod shape-determining protein MreC
MLELFRRNRVVLVSATLLLAALLMLSVGSRSEQRSDPFAGIVLEIVRPLQLSVVAAVDAVENIWSSYFSLVGVNAENERLRRRVLDLEEQLVQRAEAERADRRLQELLDFRTTLPEQAIPAQIIGRDPLPWSGTITINKGSGDGVGRHAAVVSQHGVIGQIIATSTHSARVLLITDHNSGVDAIVQRSRARGVVKGALDGRCIMKYLQRSEDVVVGDRIVTSGLDGIFPKGISVGEVTDVDLDKRGLLKTADIAPSAPLGRIEEVLVVVQRAVEEGTGEGK